MRFNVACAASLLWMWAAAFQDASAQAPTLAELMRGIASSQGVVSVFHETKEISLLAQPIESRGVMYFSPPDRLARFSFEPTRSSLIIDGDLMQFQEGSGDKFDLSGNPMARAFVDNFIVLFNGDLERLQALYETELQSEGGRWTLLLTPRAAPLNRVIADVSLAGDAAGIREMLIRNRDGDRTRTVLESSTQRAFSAAELETLFGAGSPLPEAAAAQ